MPTRRYIVAAQACWAALCHALALATLGISLVLAGQASAHAQTTDAAASPAAPATYVLGFLQYFRWPDEAGIERWQICVPAGSTADVAVYDGQTARGRPVSVRRLGPGDPVGDCQVLDLTAAPAAAAVELLQSARRQPILTVGEGAGFCTAGGMVCLRRPADGSGFEVSLTAVREGRLKASAQVLLLGRRKGGS